MSPVTLHDLSVVIEALCTRAIREEPLRFKLTGKISLWLTAVIISKHKRLQAALLLMMMWSIWNNWSLLRSVCLHILMANGVIFLQEGGKKEMFWGLKPAPPFLCIWTCVTHLKLYCVAYLFCSELLVGSSGLCTAWIISSHYTSQGKEQIVKFCGEVNFNN